MGTSNDHEGVACLILARGGSRRITKKNLAKVDGMSLIERCLKTVSSVTGFSDIWVSTDCSEIEREVRRVGLPHRRVQIHRRSEESSSDNASSLLAVQEFLQSRPEVTTVALVQCTSPFLKEEYLEDACRKMTNPTCDSVFAVKLDRSLRWRLHNGSLRATNFDPYSRPRTQDLQAEYVETGMFYFFRRCLAENGLLQGPRSDVVIIPEENCLDIDTPFDLDMARILNRMNEERSRIPEKS